MGGIRRPERTRRSNSVNQTITFSDFVSWSHKRHNMRYGLDFHRIHADSIGTGGDLGSFTFSGFATESAAQHATCTDPAAARNTAVGSPVADFLLGLPQQTGITAGPEQDLSARQLVGLVRAGRLARTLQPDYQLWPALGVLLALLGEEQPAGEPEPDWQRVRALAVADGLRHALPAGASGRRLRSCHAGHAGQAGQGPLLAARRHRVAAQVQVRRRTPWCAPATASTTTPASTRGLPRSMAFQQPFALTQTNTLSTSASNTGCTTGEHDADTTASTARAQVTQSNFGVNPELPTSAWCRYTTSASSGRCRRASC